MPFGIRRNGSVREVGETFDGLKTCDRDQDEIWRERKKRMAERSVGHGDAEIGEQQLFGVREEEREVSSLPEASICQL